jgi:hypothetical protein
MAKYILSFSENILLNERECSRYEKKYLFCDILQQRRFQKKCTKNSNAAMFMKKSNFPGPLVLQYIYRILIFVKMMIKRNRIRIS